MQPTKTNHRVAEPVAELEPCQSLQESLGSAWIAVFIVVIPFVIAAADLAIMALK